MTFSLNKDPWPPAKVERLKALWADGKSAREIGQTLRMTRNAVIGKATRLGLAQGGGVLRQAPTAPAVKRDRWPGAASARGGRPPKATPVDRAVRVGPSGHQKITAPTPVEIGEAIPANDDAVRLMSRRRSQCAWPVGTPARPAEQLCCGQPVGVGGNKATEGYCDRHRQMAVARVLVGGAPDAKKHERSLRRYVA